MMMYRKLSLTQALSELLFSQHEQNRDLYAPGSLLSFWVLHECLRVRLKLDLES